MGKALNFHEAAAIFPLMDEAGLAELCADIREHGLKEPISLQGGKILDGRNRYLACREAGVKPKFKEVKLSDSAISFVISMNLKRRHLTASQKAAAASDALPFYEKEAAFQGAREKRYGKNAGG